MWSLQTHKCLIVLQNVKTINLKAVTGYNCHHQVTLEEHGPEWRRFGTETAVAYLNTHLGIRVEVSRDDTKFSVRLQISSWPGLE